MPPLNVATAIRASATSAGVYKKETVSVASTAIALLTNLKGQLVHSISISGECVR
jgi:hypothetical protein